MSVYGGSTTQSVAGDRSDSSKSGSGSGELRERTRYEMEAINLLKEKNIKIGSSVMAEKAGHGHEGDIEVETNLYGINMEPQITLYRYDVNIVGIKQNDRKVEFARKFRDDAVVVNRRECCREAIKMFELEQQDVVSHARCLYNDLQSIMFTLSPMAYVKGLEKEAVKYSFEVSRMQSLKPNEAKLFSDYGVIKVDVVFKPHFDERAQSFGTTLDLSKIKSDTTLANRELLQFLDIATSQKIFFHQNNGAYEHVHFSTGLSYAYDPEQFGFSKDDSIVFEENQTYLAIGCHKSSQLVEGFSRAGTAGCTPALLVQPKKTPFHSDSLLIDKIKALLGNRLDSPASVMANFLRKNLKGLYVSTLHSENVQRFPIKDIQGQGASEVTITVNERPITVQEYFRERYQRELEYPKLPLVVTKFGFGAEKRTNYYPIEILAVMDNQRVTTQQQTSNMTALSIRKCAIPPFALKRQVKQTANSLHLWDSEWLKAAKIDVIASPLTVRAHHCQNPVVQAGDGRAQLPGLDASWQVKHVLRPQQVVSEQYGWSVVCFRGQSRDVLSEADLNDFLGRYMKAAQEHNIRLPKYKRIEFKNTEYIASHFKQAEADALGFMLCIHGDSDDDAHHQIKKSERQFGVISQCLKVGTVRNVVRRNQWRTTENILLKTNVKLGGLNYTLPQSKIATDNETLVIGISTNHPGGGIGELSETPEPSEAGTTKSDESHVFGPPSVVGYAANVGTTKLPFDFVGDFMYQKARREEKVNVIQAIVGKCVHYFTQFRDGLPPARVIIYRNGCSEGQFPMILKYDVPLIKHAMAEYGCADAGLTVLVPNKLQGTRFFSKHLDPKDRPTAQNIKPGTVIDASVVHPFHCEFYLNSHSTLQGTARTPKYTLLYDDNQFTLQDLEEMSYHLCYGHQIIATPVSLPAPVYIANEYAKRGRNLYKLHHPTEPNETFEDLNFALAMENSSWIGAYRVNA